MPSPIATHALGGAAIGGLGGAATGYLYNRRRGAGESEADHAARKRRGAMKGAVGGGLIGGYFGTAYGAGKHFHENYRGYYRGRGDGAGPKRPSDHRPHMHHVGLSGEEKTKAEVRKKYYQAAMKHHPDRGGKPEDMKRINNAMDEIKNSSWFQKLACGGFSAGFRIPNR